MYLQFSKPLVTKPLKPFSPVIKTGTLPQLLASYECPSPSAYSTGALHFSAQPVKASYPSDPLLPIFNAPYFFQLYGAKTRQPVKPLANVRTKLARANTVVIGDLHASFLKLAETLVAANFISMPLDKAAQFMQLSHDLEKQLAPISAAWYQWDASGHIADPGTLLSDAQKATIRSLEAALCNVVQSMQWVGGERQLILLGDALSDRWGLDTVTLAMLEHLTQQKPRRITWLASNHDLSVREGTILPFYQHLSYLLPKLLHPNTWGQDIRPHYEVYLKKAKLMQYLPKHQVLLTHAPIVQKNISELINTMNAKNMLPPEIDAYAKINKDNLLRFIVHANLYYLYSLHQRILPYWQDVIAKFVSRRDEAGMQESELPFFQKGVKVLVHGHDGNTQYKPSKSPFSADCSPRPKQYALVNLNQYLRMFPGDKINPAAEFPVYIQ